MFVLDILNSSSHFQSFQFLKAVTNAKIKIGTIISFWFLFFFASPFFLFLSYYQANWIIIFTLNDYFIPVLIIVFPLYSEWQHNA